MLLVLVTLSWWRTMLGETPSSLADWEDAADDVTWVLGHLKDMTSKRSSTVSERK
jgi:hypothetical protein